MALGIRVSLRDSLVTLSGLSPPRWLGAERIVERRLVIVSDSDCGDCEGSCAFLGGAPKGNSSGLLVSLSYLTSG